VKTTTVGDHIMTTNTYDDKTLQLVGTTVMAEPGWQLGGQLGGHRDDCHRSTSGHCWRHPAAHLVNTAAGCPPPFSAWQWAGAGEAATP
jgi:hypothetical protein